jgi:thiol-disulfide isomerase/thioredoxin
MEVSLMEKYRDIRQPLWTSVMRGGALPYDDYLANSDPIHAAKWRAMEKRIVLPDDCWDTLAGFTRKMHVLVYSAVWCGDCVRQGPILQRLADATPCLELRFIERVDGSPLAEELRINGAYKVPVAVFLSEDYFEIGRFGDRSLSAYRRMARRQTESVGVVTTVNQVIEKGRQLVGAVCNSGLIAPSQEEIEDEVVEWTDVFERMQLILRLSPLLRERYQD